MPATWVWSPTADPDGETPTLWTDWSNWVNLGTGLRASGVIPSTDHYVFDGDIDNENCSYSLSGNWTLSASITAKDGYSGDVSFDNTGMGLMQYLTIGNLTIDTSSDAFDLNLGASDILYVGNFTWDQVGDIDADDTNALASIVVQGDTVITQTGTIRLGAHLSMQGDNNFINSGSSVARPLELKKGAILDNTGTLEIRNSWIGVDANDADKEKSYFYNAGEVNLLALNTTTRFSMTFANNATVNIGAGTLRIDEYSSHNSLPGDAELYGYYQHNNIGASTNITATATLSSTAGDADYKHGFHGGLLTTVGAGTAFINSGPAGATLVRNTNVNVNHTGIGYGTLEVTGKLTFDGACTVYITVDGTTANRCDKIEASGELRLGAPGIDDVFLDVTVNGQLGANMAWDILKSGEDPKPGGVNYDFQDWNAPQGLTRTGWTRPGGGAGPWYYRLSS